jgi:hypothetical protein
MFGISQNTEEPVIDVAQVDEIEPAVRGSKPGRYHFDQIEREPLPTGHTSRRSGVRIKTPKGHRPAATVRSIGLARTTTANDEFLQGHGAGIRLFFLEFH